MTLKTVRNTLLTEMIVSLCAVALIVVLYESSLLMPGYIEDGSLVEFIMLTWMELITVCTVPLALRLFKFDTVIDATLLEQERGLLRWGTVRMLLICIPMVVNMLFYYITTLKVAFFYMSVIGMISLIFICPTMRRCKAETWK